ncbi:hypothetical protein [Marinobacter sp. UBA3607]|jgi:preprotein translocase subunit SecD|uniref:hypothetical protein n=1 Tax=Marinobacter sp. UBA3607 TaxID=1946820 RepID=UPI002580AC68|nr:hypothetical protein [Marinobacter sp. UBA3607]|tara:strand:+ start:25654 stop:26022 length:369 start_codon:yes stop_codon:yes gene_type:complete
MNIKNGLSGLVIAAAFSVCLFAVPSGAETLWDEQTAVVEFSVPVERVEKASISDDGLLWIVLDEQGRAELREMTRANLGQPVQIVMAGQVVLRFTVITEQESGRLRVQNPHQGLIEALEAFL